MRGFRAGGAALAVLSCVYSAQADVVPRASPAAGSVIARKSGEEAQFIDLAGWRGVDIQQNLLVGDELRTNAYGHLAILFSDDTQVRMGRNTTLVVKKIGQGSDSEFALQAGTIWARAERGGEALTIETPAAAAAIRGTDWTMTVEGDKTSLIVLEGVVELSNELGSVSVAQGEAAVARIGQAPTKVVIVAPKDREQMLYYLTLRQSFAAIPVSPLSGPDMRAERARIVAKPEGARGAEDWLVLAEVSLTYEGRQAALAAAAQARAFRLTAAQKARLDLIDALVAGSDQRYAEAARLFARAAPRLDAKRRAVALYGGYFARALADPNRVEQPPVIRGGGPYAALAEAWATGFLKDLKSALDVLKRAEAQYPDDPTLPAYRAQIAILLDDREQVEEAVERSLGLDPDDPNALEARATYKASIKSDLDGALADLERGIAVAPGSVTLWNALGNLQSARDAERESEVALKRAIELEPNDPVPYANLATLYLDQDRVKEAKVLIDKAMAVDPSFDIGLVTRGRYHLQTGELDKAMQDLLAGSTANPAYAQALLLLAGGHFEKGDREAGEQALENADRLDPNDPVTTSLETAIAIDDYDSDRAIRSAQDTLKRSQARGGDYAPLSANKDAGSLLNNAFRLQGLDAWGQYYGDAVFDPFEGSGYVDQALAGSVNPFLYDLNHGSTVGEASVNNSTFSSFFQGLMLDPAMLSGRSITANLFRRPFVEGSLGGGFVNTGADGGWSTEVELQGYVAGPIPWSFYGNFQANQSDEFRTSTLPGAPGPNAMFDLPLEGISGTGYFTARPTPNDRVVAYVDVRDDRSALLDSVSVPFSPTYPLLPTLYDRQLEDKTANSGLAWSHTFGFRNVANVALFASGFRRKSNEEATLFLALGPDEVFALGGRHLTASLDQNSYLAAANHMYGIGDLTLRYGIEGGALDLSASEVSTVYGLVPTPLPPETTVTFSRTNLALGRAYVDAIYDVTPSLRIEAALFGTFLNGDGANIARPEPRFAVAWTPWEGHWLRAGFLRETSAADSTTLGPIGVLGLQSNQVPLAIGGYSDTFMARWEAQWNDRLFTTLDYQHQNLTGLDIAIPWGSSLDAITLTEGRIDRVSATANLWIGHGFGAFATFAYADSENRDPDSDGFGAGLPYVPEVAARFGLTYVNPVNLRITAAATYVGQRAGNQDLAELEGYWTTDASLIWEPLDKRFELELAAYNIFDTSFSVAPDVPGWGRTVTGSLKVRF